MGLVLRPDAALITPHFPKAEAQTHWHQSFDVYAYFSGSLGMWQVYVHPDSCTSQVTAEFDTLVLNRPCLLARLAKVYARLQHIYAVEHPVRTSTQPKPPITSSSTPCTNKSTPAPSPKAAPAPSPSPNNQTTANPTPPSSGTCSFSPPPSPPQTCRKCSPSRSYPATLLFPPQSSTAAPRPRCW